MQASNVARHDGRTANELRPPGCIRGLLHQADGSARWSQQHTSVLAAVYGPRAISQWKENAEQAMIDVIWKAKIGGQLSSSDTEAQAAIRRFVETVVISEAYPRAGISVIVQVIHDDGALLACAVNAVCAALVDAAISLRGMVVAVGCAVSREGGVFLDPTKTEEKEFPASLCLALPACPISVDVNTRGNVDRLANDVPVGNQLCDGEVILSVTRGSMEVKTYLACLAKAQACCAPLSNDNSGGRLHLFTGDTAALLRVVITPPVHGVLCEYAACDICLEFVFQWLRDVVLCDCRRSPSCTRLMEGDVRGTAVPGRQRGCPLSLGEVRPVTSTCIDGGRAVEDTERTVCIGDERSGGGGVSGRCRM
ncbi:hypothetical protein CBR_g16978 [Chara braunii]|uniref:Exoribonuclease phosphorolytic domain-containing protein n=1 Tax=Chara braunii TaxID=69332 RepID=A0A388KU93_CHABU|nr:hypothetical protein CBR_g16978 [Chara braunii]|eukprot:GBG73635.1 hypothetical protein CBR_g16978 [Chara braunii]